MKMKMKLMLLVVAMAVIVGASMNPVSAATLTLEELVEVSLDKSAFNISVYPGNASYSTVDPNVTGVFGDGTVLGYRFFNSDGTVLSSYADDGTGIVAPVVPGPDAADLDGSESWANVWTTTDPGVGFANPADITEDTLARGSNITGTIDISRLSSGTVYVICGGLKNELSLTLTMSGAGKTDIQAEYSVNPGSLNKFWVVPFDFSNPEGYETITYTYTFSTARRGRFVGVIIDGLVSTATNHDPANYEIIDTVNPLTLSWTNIDPNGQPLFVDVWFGTDPCTPGQGTWEPVLVDAEDATFVDVNASAEGTYYWRIDVTIGDANTIEGQLLRFTTTNDPAPTAEIHTPAMMTWSDNPIALDATITDSGPSLLTYGWTAVHDPNLTTVDFEAGDEDPVVTVTSLTGSMDTVTMILTAFDAAHPDEIAEASVEIDVYPDACEMAKIALGTPVAATDFNADCITGLSDLTEVASVWLDNYAAASSVDMYSDGQGGTTNGGIIVYEGFQYGPVGDSLQDQPNDPSVTDIDATGLAGTWNDATGVTDNIIYIKDSSLVFGDLPIAGNSIGSDTLASKDDYDTDIFHRTLTADAQAAISGAGEIWFSILAEKLTNQGYNAEGGFALANQVLSNPAVFQNQRYEAEGLAGFAVAPTTHGGKWKAYAWDGSVRFSGDADLSVGTKGGDIRMLVGQISFDSGLLGKDRFTFYEYVLNDGSIDGGTLNQIGSTLEVDVDQSTLDTINITRRQSTNYDELRIGTRLKDVIAYNKPMNPNPEDADTVYAADPLRLSWTNADPNAETGYTETLVDVYFGTVPDSTVESEWKQVVTGQAVDFVDVDAPAGVTYYWKVDSDVGGTDKIEGDIWSFTTTLDAAPNVEILTPATMTWSDNAVALDSTVTDSGPTSMTFGWTAEPNGIGDPDLNVDFDPGAEDPVVTVTNNTGNMVSVTMTLTASDSAHPDETDEASVKILVYPDACQMAKDGLDVEVPAADLNPDCIINLLDFAQLASAWLDDYAATEAVERP